MLLILGTSPLGLMQQCRKVTRNLRTSPPSLDEESKV
jgi:hypothetical protein